MGGGGFECRVYMKSSGRLCHLKLGTVIFPALFQLLFLKIKIKSEFQAY